MSVCLCARVRVCVRARGGGSEYLYAGGWVPVCSCLLDTCMHACMHTRTYPRARTHIVCMLARSYLHTQHLMFTRWLEARHIEILSDEHIPYRHPLAHIQHLLADIKFDCRHPIPNKPRAWYELMPNARIPWIALITPLGELCYYWSLDTHMYVCVRGWGRGGNECDCVGCYGGRMSACASVCECVSMDHSSIP